MEETRIGFHIPAGITFAGHLEEEQAVEQFVNWWDNASDEEKLDAITAVDGAEVAENMAFIDQQVTHKEHVKVVAEY